MATVLVAPKRRGFTVTGASLKRVFGETALFNIVALKSLGISVSYGFCQYFSRSSAEIPFSVGGLVRLAPSWHRLRVPNTHSIHRHILLVCFLVLGSHSFGIYLFNLFSTVTTIAVFKGI